MVVAIGGSPQVPATQAISAGSVVELLLECSPASYIVADDDLSVDSEYVTVSIVEGSTNLVKLSVASGTPAGETFAVKFRQQVIVNGSVAFVKVIPDMVLQSGEDVSTTVTSNFDADPFDESAQAVIKVVGLNYDADLLFVNEGSTDTLTCTSEDIPDDLGGFLDFSMFRRVCSVASDSISANDYTLKVLSIDNNGEQIYP